MKNKIETKFTIILFPNQMSVVEIEKSIKKYQEVCSPYGANLIAISKTKPDELIVRAYEFGHRDFGENKVQDLADKYERLPKDINWHMVGHLQRNKVKYLAPFVYMIHSVDSFKLLKEINKQAIKHDRVIPVLLQVHIASESSKFGFDEQELFKMIQSDECSQLKNVRISGLMGMATFTEDQKQIEKEFQLLKRLFEETQKLQLDNMEMTELSMGMSGDFQIALECGSTMIRIGTDIFGARNYG